jgi:hypothetical protein
MRSMIVKGNLVLMCVDEQGELDLQIPPFFFSCIQEIELNSFIREGMFIVISLEYFGMIHCV